jgi:entericidin B
MKALALLLASLCAALTLSACNTVSGLGRDIERGGEKLQEKSNQNR